MEFWPFLTASAALVSLSVAAPAPASGINAVIAPLPYAPYTVTCPGSSLVRPARGLNSQESRYVCTRKTNADHNLSMWLQKHGKFNCTSQPSVGFTSSGGGYRALLETAGVVQAFDSRDSNLGTSGVYQSLTYEGGLSGGGWFLSSLAGNNWPTVTSLKQGLWETAFETTSLVPGDILSQSGATEYADVAANLVAKQAAGYDTTIVDPYGRLLSYQLLYGSEGGVGDRLSGLTTLSNFTSHNVPYPIYVTTTAFPPKQCSPQIDGPIFEFHPYEYGSWDSGISAFANTQYMGTSMTNGQPTVATQCTMNYDNLGYILGTSSDIFPDIACGPFEANNNTLGGILETLLPHGPEENDVFAVYPNPFYQYPPSSLVSKDTELTLADGGLAGQNVPIWPFIQPARHVDVLIANDNSADTTDNFPNGTEIRQTYLNAQAVGLTKMPFIPDVDTFVNEGLNKRATFFGCEQPGTVFIVYLPNVNYTFPSNEPTLKLQYTKEETDGMIANGVQIGTQNGDAGWPKCLACAIKNVKGSAPSTDGCHACFQKYCYIR